MTLRVFELAGLHEDWLTQLVTETILSGKTAVTLLASVEILRISDPKSSAVSRGSRANQSSRK